MNDGTGGSCSSDPVGTPVQVVGVLKEEEEDFAMLGKVPLDEEGFVVSFSSEQTEEYLAFFQRWGFIVVSDALTEEQCHETFEEMWGDIERPEHTLDLTEWEGERPDIAILKSYVKKKINIMAFQTKKHSFFTFYFFVGLWKKDIF